MLYSCVPGFFEASFRVAMNIGSRSIDASAPWRGLQRRTVRSDRSVQKEVDNGLDTNVDLGDMPDRHCRLR
jgi:hypothetical protein